MALPLNIIAAQINCWVGDIEGNSQRIISCMQAEVTQKADLVVFPELTLTGYPPEDLLLRGDLKHRVNTALQRLCEVSCTAAMVVGHPHWQDGKLFNAASVIHQGAIQVTYCKQRLPNHGVFDEKRYFAEGSENCVFEISGHRVGLLICEDLWGHGPIQQLKALGAELIVALNASPYHKDKHPQRLAMMSERAKEVQLPLVYVNAICGQDELIFDGRSIVLDQHGGLITEAKAFEEELLSISWDGAHITSPRDIPPALIYEAEVYKGLVLAVRDYVTRNGFKGAVLGLSGGIDSALTLAIAVDALGAENVHAVMMPFRYTASMSIEDAEAQAKMLGVTYQSISIEPVFDAFMQQLSSTFADTAVDTTEENLQARCRGAMLMAISNKQRRIVLTTGNKSEMAVGYATLYGDMCGGFAPIKDVPKTLVFKLSNYRNQLSPAIPQRVIDRPPSAELAPDQIDEDSLPPYDELDQILEYYVEQDKSVAEIVAAGYSEEIVRHVIRLVDINEYKRRQSAVGPKITKRNFGKGRRYPICSGFGRNNW